MPISILILYFIYSIYNSYILFIFFMNYFDESAHHCHSLARPKAWDLEHNPLCAVKGREGSATPSDLFRSPKRKRYPEDIQKISRRYEEI